MFGFNPKNALRSDLAHSYIHEELIMWTEVWITHRILEGKKILII